jgi:hypothetical protein
MTLLAQIQALDPALIASRDEYALAAALSVGRTKTVKVPIADVQANLQTTGLWWSVKAVAADAAHPAHAAAIALMDVANARYDNIDMTLPIVAQMLGELVSAGVMTQAQMDALTGMGVVPDPVDPMVVRQAIWNDDGSSTL